MMISLLRVSLATLLVAVSVHISASERTTLFGTLSPDPVSGEWRTTTTVLPVPVVPSIEAAAGQRSIARTAVDRIVTKAPPPGYGYVWKVVLLLYPSINCNQTVSSVTTNFTYTMNAAEIAEAQLAFENMAVGIYEGSNHEARLQLTMVTVGRTLTQLAVFGADVHWPDAAITAPELQAYCANGLADSAMVYWPAKNHSNNTSINNPYWGLSYGAPAGFTYNVGYSTVSNILSPMLAGYYPGEVMIHEWMHPATDYYRAVWGYNVPNLDGAGNYKPCPSCANYALVSGDGWMPFYRDFLKGTVWNPAMNRYEGVPAAAWRSGTPTNTLAPLTGAQGWENYY